jgi:hypothetical protein
MPNKNETRHPASPRWGGNSPPKMPLMPSTRPFNKMNSAEATPNKMPPASEAHGVKCAQSIVIDHSLS